MPAAQEGTLSRIDEDMERPLVALSDRVNYGTD